MRWTAKSRARHANGQRYSHYQGSRGGDGRKLWVRIEESIGKEIRRGATRGHDREWLMARIGEIYRKYNVRIDE